MCDFFLSTIQSLIVKHFEIVILSIPYFVWPMKTYRDPIYNLKKSKIAQIKKFLYKFWKILCIFGARGGNGK